MTTRPTTIAIGAMGGQGGGVLAGWIVDMAEQEGYLAQSTSVPGVAQRTGATIYCVEIFPRAVAEEAGREPVLALMPMPGDVEVVIASELMEAGRAVQRGLVTPDKTILIASSHRDYAISEKSGMADGRTDSGAIMKAAAAEARRFIHMDMAAMAAATGSVLSSILFGALAGSEALPFPREAFEAAIRRGGVAVENSLAGFAAGFDGAEGKVAAAPAAAAPRPPVVVNRQAASIRERILANFPDGLQSLVIEGARRCADFQDWRHAQEYVALVAAMLARDSDADFYALTQAYAKHLALWMTYEDVVRVADLKTRAERFQEIRREVRAEPGEIVAVSEYMHPRFEEVCDTLPRWLGGALARSRIARSLSAPLFRRGRRVRTTGLPGFLLLYLLSSLRRWRPGSLRFAREMASIEAWAARIERLQMTDYALAVEVARCQRLIKGYGDTHARGTKNFASIMQAADRLAGRKDAARLVATLIDAALADEHGAALDKALAGIGGEAAA